MEEAYASSFAVFREGTVMWDATTQTALSAIQGLSMRSSARAHNIANAETPGFRASHVDFESSLRDAVQRGDPTSMDAQTTPSPTVVGPNGNSVDLETEMIGALRDGVHRQMMFEAFNFKAAQIRVSVGGRR